jgi:hypothetical protein
MGADESVRTFHRPGDRRVDRDHGRRRHARASWQRKLFAAYKLDSMLSPPKLERIRSRLYQSQVPNSAFRRFEKGP